MEAKWYLVKTKPLSETRVFTRLNGAGYEGRIVRDLSKKDGQPRRCLDTSRANVAFGFTARTPLEEGLRRTVAWYEAARKERPKP